MAIVPERRRKGLLERNLDIQLNKRMVSIILYPQLPGLMPGTQLDPSQHPPQVPSNAWFPPRRAPYHKSGPLGSVTKRTCWYHDLSGGFVRSSHSLLLLTWNLNSSLCLAMPCAKLWSHAATKSSLRNPGTVNHSPFRISFFTLVKSWTGFLNSFWFHHSGKFKSSNSEKIYKRSNGINLSQVCISLGKYGK